MKNWKRILAALLALAMLFSMAAISEEAPVSEQVEEPEQVEVLTEETVEPAAEESVEEEPAEEEPAEEPVEEPTEEAAEEPEQEVPVESEPSEGESEAEEPAEGEEPSGEDLELEDLNVEQCEDGEHDFWDYEKDEPSDTCAVCGYKCPHKMSYKYPWDRIDHAVQVDQSRHIAYFDRIQIISCMTCGMVLDNKTLKTNLSAVEWHSFFDYDEEGEEVDSDTCYYCGYTKQECKHEETRIYYVPLDSDVQYKKVDALTHKMSGNMELIEECENCHVTLREEEGYYTDIVEEHDFDSTDEDDVCLCGAKLDYDKCKHPAYDYYPGWDYHAYLVNYGNPTYHYVHYDEAVRQCRLCGKEENISNFNLKEEHEFKDGSSVCVLCGYKVQAASISIDTPAKTSLNVGETLNLTATIAPANAVSERLWYSSNRTVATVSKAGVVTALAAGTTNITAKTENGKASKALKITVVDPRIPTKLTLPKTLSAELGQTMDMKAQLTALEPATAELKWSSSKPEIVEIDEQTGSAQMLDTGTAKISVTAATASGKGVKSASVTLTVTDPKAPSKITLSPSGKIKMSTDDEPKQITATLNAEAQDTCKIEWTSSKPDVAQVDASGKITAIAKGTAKITATASKKSSAGKKVTASLTVQVTQDTFKPTDIQLSEVGPLTLTTDSAPVQIVATVLPEDVRSGGVTWKNSNGYAVKLDPATGTITPQAAGSATITISSKKKAANKKAVVKKIQVTVTDPHAITKFALEQTGTKKLFLGESLTLTPVFGGADERSAVSYKAKKNKGIIELDAETGEIKPLKEGTVEITATTAKKVGSGKNAKAKSAKVKIQVVDPKRPKEVAIDQKDSLKNISIGTPVQLSCTITTENGETIQTSSEGVKWSVKDTKKALIDDEGNLYALKSGVSITVTVTTDAKGVNGKQKKATLVLKS